jgi:GH24 family phage-related lysozyme (muramidase)
MGGGAGNDLVPGGYQYEFDPSNLQIDPELRFVNRPGTDRGIGGIYRGSYNPLNPVGWTFTPPSVQAQPATTQPASAPVDDPYPEPTNFYDPKEGPMKLDERKAFDAAVAAWAARNPGVVPRPPDVPASATQRSNIQPPLPSTAPNALSPQAPQAPLTGAGKRLFTRGDFITGIEGPALTQQPDLGNTVTIGHGHQITDAERRAGGIRLLSGEVIPLNNITPEQQRKLFYEYDWPQYEAGVKRQLPEYDSLNDHQKEAIVSYLYNVGANHALPNGFAEAVKRGDMQGAADALRQGVATGVGVGPMPVLARRRGAEADLFMLPPDQQPNMQAVLQQVYGGRSYGTGAKSGAAGGGTGQQLPPVSVSGAGAQPNTGPWEPPPPSDAVKRLLGPEGDQAALRRALMFGMLGHALQGTKFTPIDYDPFKVQQGIDEGLHSPKMRTDVPAYEPRESPVVGYRPPAYTMSVGKGISEPKPVEGGAVGIGGGVRRADPASAIVQSRFYENLFS